MAAKRILLTGGGTGGHITPLLVVAHELKQTDPDCHIVYVGERKGAFAHLTDKDPNIDEVHTIFAGKFRRYHGQSWLTRVLDIKTLVLNIRDFFYFLIGVVQALFMVRRLKPDVMLLKGGFVGVPTGFAGAFWHIPIVTHDSDAIPGLANRIIARWALYHATALPASHYPYPSKSVKHVGVLVSDNHKAVSNHQQEAFKKELGLENKTVMLVTGASSGAAIINEAIKKLLPKLLEDYPKLHVIHQVGQGKTGVYQGYSHERLSIYEFLKPMYIYTGASDLVVTRGSATNLAELGVQGRASIAIPSPWLAGGHQLQNVIELEEKGAAVVVQEATLEPEPTALDEAIRELLDDPHKRAQLGQKLQAITIPDATRKLSMILLEIANRH